MKLSNKPNLVTGTVLLLVAAFFSISLALLPLDFGASWQGNSNPLYIYAYTLGNILFSVYGFSSIWIPVFLFAAGVSCFATRWTARKSMQLLTAIIPFFTSVAIEKICVSINEFPDEFSTIKIVLTLAVGIFLIAIEILTAGLLADKINDRLFHHTGTSAKPAESSEVTENAEEIKKPETRAETAAPANDVIEEVTLDDITSSAPEVTVSETTETAPKTTDASSEENEEEEERDDPFADVFDEEDETFNFPEEEELEDESDEEKQESQDNDFSEPEKERTEPILSKEEYDALNKLNEDLLEENSLEEQEKNDNDSVEQLEWPATDEIISRAGITKDEEDSLIGENKEPEKPETNAEETEDEEDPYSAFDIDSAASDDGEYKTLSEEDEKLYEDANFLSADEEKKTENTLEPDFFDIDMNAEPEEAESGSDYEEDSYDEVNLEEDEDNYDSYNETSEDEQTTREMQALENDLLSEKASHESSVEEKRSFLDDMVNAQEDDEDFAEESEYSDSDEDDFGQTNSTFDIASDIFSDMEEDAREQLEAGKKPARFADPSEQTEEELAEEIKQDEDEAFETAEPPARTTIATEKKPEGHRALPKKPYIVPTDLLEQYEDDQYWIIDEATKSDATKLKETLNQFGISAEIIGIKKGPVVTMFEIAPAPGVKLSKIVSLQDNIALSLAASSVRIVAPIPGKAAVGIETPNKKRSIVSFREIIEQDIPEFKKMAIPVILGKDILGKSQIIDIAKTPHLLIAGATGAGKSVCVNSLILSILYKRSPREVKMILVDPKVVELKLYNDIPHLLTPVITEPKRALQALQYCLCEMERRYALLDGLGVRDISNYNKRVEERNICTEKLPYIVVIIDEFADLMATSGRDLESIVARLTAMSRAVGIHLVLATQRPSVNVITGLIKANIPSRIAFMVSSRTDSNIIIDSVGAEKLLGKGDMLYASAVDPYPVRIQGTFESDNDVEAVVDYVKTLGEPEYIDEEIFIDEEEEEQGPSIFSEGDDPLYEQALEIVLQSGKASASYIQRRLKIGYNRAARLVEEMEARGIVGPANGSKPREVIHVPS